LPLVVLRRAFRGDGRIRALIAKDRKASSGMLALVTCKADDVESDVSVRRAGRIRAAVATPS
jgi:hypothetical protein